MTLHIHLLTRLDAIRETQLHQGQVIAETASAVSTLKAASSRQGTSKESSIPAVVGASQWVGGILALACLWRGGDVQTVMAFLQKLF